MNTEELRIYLEIVSSLVTILGLPLVLFIFLNEKKRDRNERKYVKYEALDDQYTDFLKLCMSNPDLDVYQVSGNNTNGYSAAQITRMLIIFEILISLFEKAFLMYRDQGTAMRKKSWSRWNEYMKEWTRRENFWKAWENLENQWDTRFELYMNSIREKIKTQTRLERAGVV